MSDANEKTLTRALIGLYLALQWDDDWGTFEDVIARAMKGDVQAREWCILAIHKAGAELVNRQLDQFMRDEGISDEEPSPAPQGKGATGLQPRELPDPEALARLFHETYERLAPNYGYQTRMATARPWDEVPEKNRSLMVATCALVLAELR